MWVERCTPRVSSLPSMAFSTPPASPLRCEDCPRHSNWYWCLQWSAYRSRCIWSFFLQVPPRPRPLLKRACASLSRTHTHARARTHTYSLTRSIDRLLVRSGRPLLLLQSDDRKERRVDGCYGPWRREGHKGSLRQLDFVVFVLARARLMPITTFGMCIGACTRRFVVYVLSPSSSPPTGLPHRCDRSSWDENLSSPL